MSTGEPVSTEGAPTEETLRAADIRAYIKLQEQKYWRVESMSADLQFRWRQLMSATEPVPSSTFQKLRNETIANLAEMEQRSRTAVGKWLPGTLVQTLFGVGEVIGAYKIGLLWSIGVRLRDNGRTYFIAPRSIKGTADTLPEPRTIDDGSYQLISGVAGKEWDTVDPEKPLRDILMSVPVPEAASYQLIKGEPMKLRIIVGGQETEVAVATTDYANSVLECQNAGAILKKYPIPSFPVKTSKGGVLYLKAAIDILPSVRESEAEKVAAYDYKLTPEETIGFAKEDHIYIGMTAHSFAGKYGLDPQIHTRVLNGAIKGGAIAPISSQKNILTADLKKATVCWEEDMQALLSMQVNAAGEVLHPFSVDGSNDPASIELRPAVVLTEYLRSKKLEGGAAAAALAKIRQKFFPIRIEGEILGRRPEGHIGPVQVWWKHEIDSVL